MVTGFLMGMAAILGGGYAHHVAKVLLSRHKRKSEKKAKRTEILARKAEIDLNFELRKEEENLRRSIEALEHVNLPERPWDEWRHLDSCQTCQALKPAPYPLYEPPDAIQAYADRLMGSASMETWGKWLDAGKPAVPIEDFSVRASEQRKWEAMRKKHNLEIAKALGIPTAKIDHHQSECECPKCTLMRKNQRQRNFEDTIAGFTKATLDAAKKTMVLPGEHVITASEIRTGSITADRIYPENRLLAAMQAAHPDWLITWNGPAEATQAEVLIDGYYERWSIEPDGIRHQRLREPADEEEVYEINGDDNVISTFTYRRQNHG